MEEFIRQHFHQNSHMFNGGIDLNNEGYRAEQRGDHKTALEKYSQALEIKVKTHGENSVYFLRLKHFYKVNFFNLF